MCVCVCNLNFFLRKGHEVILYNQSVCDTVNLGLVLLVRMCVCIRWMFYVT